MKTKLLSSILIALFLVLTIQFVSAEIIWSQPTGVPFTIVNSSNNSTELIVNIIKPVSKTYFTKIIPIEVRINKIASCSYSLDNKPYVFLGNGDYLSSSVNVTTNGDHNIKVLCYADSQSKLEQVNFKVKPRTSTNPYIDSDNEYEEGLYNPLYGDWVCVNNKLQRDILINNVLFDVEYGQVCGLELPPTEKNDLKIRLFWLLALIFFILILIVLILIAMLLISRR